MEQAPSIFVDQRRRQQVTDEKDAPIADLVQRTREEKREMIAALKAEYAVQDLCALVGCPRSSYYYQAQAKDERA